MMEKNYDATNEFRKKRNEAYNLKMELKFLEERKQYLKQEYKIKEKSISELELPEMTLAQKIEELKTIDKELVEINIAIEARQSQYMIVNQELDNFQK